MSDRVKLIVDSFIRRSFVRAYGELDLGSVSQLDLTLRTAAAGRPGDVFLDLTGVTFLDARALGVLAATDRELRRTGRRLQVHGLNRLQQRMLQITGLDGMLLLPGRPPAGRWRCAPRTAYGSSAQT